ncbi:WD40 repeat-like protein [Calocera viscosa TUFC12733]|uniref:WD40 repeat-like protein n=1 Tax=Calocera viscosa (strain TUFC12733) TaxID=1330018 RepID=A0A167MV15_CALVF|nr:WD40 repeat-like protein [Calocera viscosa TUFC12733]
MASDLRGSSPLGKRRRSEPDINFHSNARGMTLSPATSASSSRPRLFPDGRRILPSLRGDGIAADTLRARRRAMDATLGSFRYSSKLRAHKSCINALAFSKGEGRWLASGGDDRTVLLWDMHEDEEERKPRARLRGHRSNIFTLSFNASNTHIYSGANDDIVTRYDLSRLDNSGARAIVGAPDNVFLDQEGAIHSVSAHPYNDNTFLSASEDGLIRFEDCREAASTKGWITNNASFSDVKWHPTDGNLFISTDQRGRVTLHDARHAFKSTPTTRIEATVISYVTTLSIALGNDIEAITGPEASSVSFTNAGNLFAVEFLLYGPVIYSLSDPFPVLTLSGNTLPSGDPTPQGQRSYTNKCTTKHGGFGGDEHGSLYYGTGSDDFRGYCWKIPPLQTLLHKRHEIEPSSWKTRSNISMAFAKSKTSTKHLPERILTPSYRLEGHKSIVNSVLFHPTQPMIATSGIERFVRLFTHFPTKPGQEPIKPSETRELPAREDPTIVSRALRGEITTETEFSDDDGAVAEDQEDMETIHLFDQLLRQEEADLDYAHNLEGLRWRLVHDSSSEDDDGDEEEEEDEDDDEADQLAEAIDMEEEERCASADDMLQGVVDDESDNADMDWEDAAALLPHLDRQERG